MEVAAMAAEDTVVAVTAEAAMVAIEATVATAEAAMAAEGAAVEVMGSAGAAMAATDAAGTAAAATERESFLSPATLSFSNVFWRRHAWRPCGEAKAAVKRHAEHVRGIHRRHTAVQAGQDERKRVF